ncbi:MAG: ThuA domain-containing protein [Planctomycetaceae bacterium]|nr:ThuA domain-containing protein [Planctomycetaceae bacterium]
MTRWLCVLTALTALVATASAQEKPKARALMLTQSVGFVHGSVNRKEQTLAPAEIAMTQLGQQTGLFEVHCTQNAEADFTKENLAKYQLIMFYTTGKLPISEENLDYFFKDWLPAKGHAFIGFHSATDTLHDYQPYWDMVGGTFTEHPWNAGDTVTISVHDTAHPAMKPFGEEFQFKDEIYQYKNWQPDKVHLLMSLNMAKLKTKRPYLVPVSWVKEYGEGRMFYTNLGHNEGTWTNPQFLAHVTGGVQWALGLAEGSAKPNPELSAKLERKARADQEWKSGIEWETPRVIGTDPVPSDAVVLFDGQDLSQWDGGDKWEIKDGYAISKGGSITTKDSFGDCQLHIEWASPEKIEGSGQGCGNSGVYLMGKYEVQVLDSFENDTYVDGQAGSIYKTKPPLVNASRKPGEWQAYDIIFHAPKFDDAGQLQKPGFVTVLHNGVLIQDHTELLGTTSYTAPPSYERHSPRLPLSLQYHGNAVRFRNIWIREIPDIVGKRPE